MTQTAQALTPTAQEAICEALNQCLAESAVGTMLAQNFHWNVTGMAFGPLHDLFQQMYEDHFAAQDAIAERIKALGGHAEGQLAQMLKRSKVSEDDARSGPEAMIKAMAKAQETLANTLAGAAAMAEEHGDLLTQDLMIERGQTHEKFAWMLRAHLQ